METIEYIMLSDRNQKEINRDSDEQYDWYARPHAKGHRLLRVEKRQQELVSAQGGLDNWLKVVFQ